VLLPRQALPGDQVSGAFLRHHQAETTAAAATAANGSGSHDAAPHGSDARRRHGGAEHGVDAVVAEPLPAKRRPGAYLGRKTHRRRGHGGGESRRVVGDGNSTAAGGGAARCSHGPAPGDDDIGGHNEEHSRTSTTAAFVDAHRWSRGTKQDGGTVWDSFELRRRHRTGCRHPGAPAGLVHGRSDTAEHRGRGTADDRRWATTATSDLCLWTGQCGRQSGNTAETTVNSEVTGVAPATTTGAQHTQEQSTADGYIHQPGQRWFRSVL